MVGIFPGDAVLIWLAGMLLIEQHDEWLIARRYLGLELIKASLAVSEPTEAVRLDQPAA